MKHSAMSGRFRKIRKVDYANFGIYRLRIQ